MPHFFLKRVRVPAAFAENVKAIERVKCSRIRTAIIFFMFIPRKYCYPDIKRIVNGGQLIILWVVTFVFAGTPTFYSII